MRTTVYDIVRASHPQAAIPDRPREPRMTVMQHVHDDADRALSGLEHIGGALQRMYPVLKTIAADPRVAELVHAALAARDAGVADEVFAGAGDMLKLATMRKRGNGTGPQPAVTPPADVPEPEDVPPGPSGTAMSDNGQPEVTA